jgi:hypothetical protein
MGYRGDPYWMTARFSSTCACGEHQVKKGERIFYYPNGRSAYGGKCAEAASRDFQSARFDEQGY